VSRPTQPAPEKTFFDVLAVDIREILNQSAAPETWGDREAFALFHAVCAPHTLDALPLIPSEGDITDEMFFGNAIDIEDGGFLSDNAMMALFFAHLYASAPIAVRKSLDGIDALIEKRMKSPEIAAAFFITQHPETWESKADAVAEVVKEQLGIPVTPKIIEHARNRIRSSSAWSFPA
jgi:hypothetical protein